MAVFGKGSAALSPRDAIDNKLFTMADLAKFAFQGSVVDHGLVSLWSAHSRRAIAHESASQIGFLTVA
jgi:hypothetical protein